MDGLGINVVLIWYKCLFCCRIRGLVVVLGIWIFFEMFEIIYGLGYIIDLLVKLWGFIENVLLEFSIFLGKLIFIKFFGYNVIDWGGVWIMCVLCIVCLWVWEVDDLYVYIYLLFIYILWWEGWIDMLFIFINGMFVRIFVFRFFMIRFLK